MITSNWVKNILEAIQANRYDIIESEVERIDKLLRRSMQSTDDENLADQIRKEING